MKTLKTLAIGGAFLAFANPAFAQTLGGGGCANDLTLSAGSSLVNCYGRLGGNTLSNNPGDNAANNAALLALGYVGPVIAYNTIGAQWIDSSGNAVRNFPGTFNGTVYLGIHYGNGSGQGNNTTFYRLNASNLDLIGLNLQGSSTATVFAQIASPVPEPASWALLLAGFGALGFTLRRRPQVRVRYA